MGIERTMLEARLWNTPEEAREVRRRWDQDTVNAFYEVGIRAAADLAAGIEFQLMRALIQKVSLELAPLASNGGSTSDG